MLPPLEGPSVSQGKRIVMSTTVTEEKKVTPVADEKKATPVAEVKKAAPQDAAGPQKVPVASTFDGRIVSLNGDKLVMSNKDGKEFSKTLADDAKLTCDGTVCKSGDLKPGHKIRVTTKADDRTVATGIESLNKNAEFAQCS